MVTRQRKNDEKRRDNKLGNKKLGHMSPPFKKKKNIGSPSCGGSVNGWMNTITHPLVNENGGTRVTGSEGPGVTDVKKNKT